MASSTVREGAPAGRAKAIGAMQRREAPRGSCASWQRPRVRADGAREAPRRIGAGCTEMSSSTIGVPDGHRGMDEPANGSTPSPSRAQYVAPEFDVAGTLRWLQLVRERCASSANVRPVPPASRRSSARGRPGTGTRTPERAGRRLPRAPLRSSSRRRASSAPSCCNTTGTAMTPCPPIRRRDDAIVAGGGGLRLQGWRRRLAEPRGCRIAGSHVTPSFPRPAPPADRAPGDAIPRKRAERRRARRSSARTSGAGTTGRATRTRAAGAPRAG